MSGNFIEANKPLELFSQWLADAEAKEPNDPNAMAVATVDETGMPNVRMVLLKEFSDQGFVFYTNFESAKGQELLKSEKTALLFHWKSLRRQVRIRGEVGLVSSGEADTYFQSRARGSRIGAWASKQSRPLESRFALEKSVAEYTAKFGLGTVPRPEYWSGFVVRPEQIEFWHDRPFRLHNRVLFKTAGDGWEKSQLYP